MSIISRPAKQGGSTTYQGKVAQGFKRILAAEADADFNTIFDAWNDGVDAVNVRPNAITAEKIAPNVISPRELVDDLAGAILAVDAITARELGPDSVNTTELVNGAVTLAKCAADVTARLNGDLASATLRLTSRGMLLALATTLDVLANSEGSLNYDVAKAGWMLRQDYQTDRWQVWRRTPGTTSWVLKFQVDPTGVVYTPGTVDKKTTAAMLSHSVAASYPVSYDGAVSFNTATFDTLGNIADAAQSRFNLNSEWCTLSFNCTLNPAVAGFGANMYIETWTGSVWVPRARQYLDGNQTSVNLTMQATGQLARVRFQNAGTAATALEQPFFACTRHGRLT